MNFTYHVPDMTCGHCERAITASVKAAVPAANVAVDLAAHQVVVSGATDETRVAAAIKEAGYRAVPV